MIETHEGIRDQDLEDLRERWRKDVEKLKTDWTPEASRRTMESFNAILEYLHAGEVPDVSDMKDGSLFKVEKVGGGTL